MASDHEAGSPLSEAAALAVRAQLDQVDAALRDWREGLDKVSEKLDQEWLTSVNIRG